MSRARKEPGTRGVHGRALALVLIPALALAGGCGGIDLDDDPDRLDARAAIVLVSPSQGSPSGGTSVRMDTSGFVDGFGFVVPAVTFGGVPAVVVAVPSASQLDVSTPAAAGPGAVDVVVTSADGSQTATLSGGFVYTTAPVIHAVQPSTGHPAGGEPATITGENFDPAGVTDVTFGGASAASISVRDTNTITCITPPGPAGACVVTVVNPDGQGNSLADGFLFRTPPPAIFGLSPSFGEPTGGDTVTIDGAGFDTIGAVEVWFDALPATGVSVIDAGTIECVTPAALPGLATVWVIHADGQVGALVDGFRYTSVPRVLSLSPDRGDSSGGDLVAIQGASFDPLGMVAVEFGGVPATVVSVVDASTITCEAPGGMPGPVTVRVTNGDGAWGERVDGYAYMGVDPAVPAAELELLDLINQERASVGKGPLAMHPIVRGLCRAHAEDMRDNDYFSYNNLQGESPGTRLNDAGIDWWSWGMSIDMHDGALDPALYTFYRWKADPPHHDLMIDARNWGFQYVGVGAARSGDDWWFVALHVEL